MATRGAVIDGAAASSTGDIDATAYASPTVVFLRNALNAPIAYVAVGTAIGLKTFAASNLAAGPGVTLGGPAQTPMVPVQPTGVTPNPVFGNLVTSAPVIYVASDTGNTTTVFQVGGTAAGLGVLRTSPVLNGAPAPGLGTDQIAEADMKQGKLVVTTGANLYLLTTQDLDRAGQFDVGDDLVPGSTGFRQTVAAVSGEYVYAANDQGQQFVLRVSDGKPVAPTPDTAVSGTVTFTTQAFDARGISSLTFRSNGQPFGTDTVADSGPRSAAPALRTRSPWTPITSLRAST